MSNGHRFILIALLWLTAGVLALAVDARIARLVRDSGAETFLRTHRSIAETIKAPGEFVFTIVVIIVVGVLHPRRSRASVFVLASCAVTLLNRPVQWIIGRVRPFRVEGAPDQLDPFHADPFRGGIVGLFNAKNLCFPSGHTTLAFATAAALGMLWPRLRPLWYFGASIVAIERVAENAHWLSDCVVGAALGIGGVYLVAWLLRSWKITSHTSRS